MKVLVVPRDAAVYQELLYAPVRAAGVDVAYAEGPSGSQTLNLLLAPLVLCGYRSRGFRILHVHWVFGFQLPWARGSRLARRAMRAWFAFYLAVAQKVGYRIVWTAHNIVPHEPVFDDDLAARRCLVRRADVVFAHSERAADAVATIFGAKDVRVVPQGGDAAAYPDGPGREVARRRLGYDVHDVVAIFFGRVMRYKGVEDLLAAVGLLDAASPLRVLVAGACLDSALREDLESSAMPHLDRVTLKFGRVPDDQVAAYLQAADIAVFPFRRITNSGSLLLAYEFGVPAVVPDLPQLLDLPSGATVRYEGGPAGLAAALDSLSTDHQRRTEMALAAQEYAATLSWDDLATATVATYTELLAVRTGTPVPAR